MKFPLYVSLLTLFLALPALAREPGESDGVRRGGISGGGGGTTVANPVSQEQLTRVIQTFTAPIAYSWLKGSEQRFRDLSPAEQGKSPVRVLFGGPKNVYQVLHATPVELRASRPCLDSEGAEREGSIYAETPGAVCLSTFLMAPKLSVPEAPRQAIALYVHELSHLLGANEEEAQAVQDQMLSDLMFADKARIVTNSELGHGLWDVELRAWVNLMVKNPERLNAKNAGELAERFERTYYDLTDNVAFSTLRPELRSQFIANRALLESVLDFLCLSDPYKTGEEKAACSAQTEKTFGGEASVSARDFLLQRVDYKGNTMMFNPDLLGPVETAFVIERIETPESAIQAMKKLDAYLGAVSAEMGEQSEFAIQFAER